MQIDGSTNLETGGNMINSKTKKGNEVSPKYCFYVQYFFVFQLDVKHLPAKKPSHLDRAERLFI